MGSSAEGSQPTTTTRKRPDLDYAKSVGLLTYIGLKFILKLRTADENDDVIRFYKIIGVAYNIFP